MTRIYKRKPKSRSRAATEEAKDYAAELVQQLALIGLPVPVREFRFHKTRKWKADLAWPREKVIIEIEGGVFSGGRHVRAIGFMHDMEKYNEAAILGYALFRVTPSQVMQGIALALVERIFKERKG